MRKRRFNPRALRRLAEQLLDDIAAGEEIPEDERQDLATSLVRQWQTYGGSATLFFGEFQVYLVLGKTPRGKPCVFPEPVPPGWLSHLARDWKVRPADLPQVIDRLNRAQSAEVVASDGIPLRLWVNPGERRRGVEPLVGQQSPPAATWDYCQLAAHALERQLGGGLDPKQLHELAGSVAQQWQRFGGHACLFLDGHQQLVFTLTDHGDGPCQVVATRMRADLEQVLSSLGVPPEAVPQLIARLNLGQAVECRDRQGTAAVLWHDPQARRINVRKVGRVAQAEPVQTPPAFCPQCTAVLKPWREGERYQTCAQCGYTMSLSWQPPVPVQTPPALCPACTAVLRPWREGERHQTCRHCGHTVSLS